MTGAGLSALRAAAAAGALVTACAHDTCFVAAPQRAGFQSRGHALSSRLAEPAWGGWGSRPRWAGGGLRMMDKGFGTSKPKGKRKGKGKGKGPAVATKGSKTASKPFGNFKFTGKIRPGKLTPTRTIPEGIEKPDYALDGVPKAKGPRFPWDIEVKSEEDIAGMRAAGTVAREVLDAAGRAVRAGATTDEVDRVAHEETVARGAYPSPLNYHGFPKSCCVSIDEIVCHGIPDSTVLEEGMIVNVDVTVFYKGYHGDCSEMFCVGEVDDKAKELLQVTYDCWQEAIKFCKPGKAYKEIGGIIENYVKPRGYQTVQNFCGHGIGKVFHTNPSILHYKNREPNGIMKAGHTFTIEPMICEGTARNVVWPDNWTAATLDGRRTAQFEHTLLLTENGAEPLTAKLETSMGHFWEEAA